RGRQGAGRQEILPAPQDGHRPQIVRGMARAGTGLFRQLWRSHPAGLVRGMVETNENAPHGQRQDGARMRSAATEGCRPGSALYGEVVEFLHREAKLLDGFQFDEWVKLFADDIRYLMPVRNTQLLKHGEGFNEMAFFDDNLISLKTRVERL